MKFTIKGSKKRVALAKMTHYLRKKKQKWPLMDASRPAALKAFRATRNDAASVLRMKRSRDWDSKTVSAAYIGGGKFRRITKKNPYRKPR